MKIPNSCTSKFVVFFLSLIIGLAVSSAFAEEVLKNESIIELQKIGLSENTIVQKIKTSKCSFDTSISALKQLKSANVSDSIIQAMMASSSSSSSASSAVVATSASSPLKSGNVNDPSVSHELGIWLYQNEAGKGTMTEMEPAIFNQMKMGSGWGMAWGGSSHMRVVLNGPKAKMQLSERKPVFYIYFGESSLNGATSPAEFTLVRAEIKKDHDIDTRMIVVGKISGYGGSSMGFDQKFVVPFDYEKIAKGAYKVVPKEDLTDAEYCFCQGSFAAGASSKVYDFGISAVK